MRNDPALAALIRERLDPARTVGGGERAVWLRTVGEFTANIGARSMLAHVTPGDWIRHYAANEDAFSAVVDELRRID